MFISMVFFWTKKSPGKTMGFTMGFTHGFAHGINTMKKNPAKRRHGPRCIGAQGAPALDVAQDAFGETWVSRCETVGVF